MTIPFDRDHFYGTSFYSDPPKERVNDRASAVFGTFSVQVLRRALTRVTIRAAGRRVLPVEAFAEEGDAGLLRRLHAVERRRRPSCHPSRRRQQGRTYDHRKADLHESAMNVLWRVGSER